MTFIYGLNPVRELVKHRPEQVKEILISRRDEILEEIFELSKGVDIKVRFASRPELDRLAGTKEHQGIIARAPLPEPVLFEDLLEKAKENPTALIIFLDQIEDPQNLGAIIRTAECLGALGVVLPKHKSARITPAVAKASAGAVEWVPHSIVTNLARAIEKAKEAGFWIYGAFPQAGEKLGQVEFSAKSGIVIGSEGRGIRAGVAQHCDFQISIPLFGKIASLNASVACALICYEYQRQIKEKTSKEKRRRK